MARKGSRPKARPSRGGKDPLTGSSIDIQGFLFQSDKTYSQSELPFTLFEDSGQDEIEFELSKDAIIVKWRHPFTTPDGENRLLDGLQVYLGSFSYDRQGKLNQGKVTELSSWTYKGVDKSGRVEEYITVDTGAGSGTTPVQLAANLNNQVFSYDSLYPSSNAPDTKSDFYAYQSSKFYKDNWWSNSFESNLI